jgi:hypothetical protein
MGGGMEGQLGPQPGTISPNLARILAFLRMVLRKTLKKSCKRKEGKQKGKHVAEHHDGGHAGYLACRVGSALTAAIETDGRVPPEMVLIAPFRIGRRTG